MTVDEIVAAIRALPLPERLRLIAIVAREAAIDVVAAEAGSVTLIERNGLLIADADVVLPAGVFDHRLDREARDAHLWGDP